MTFWGTQFDQILVKLYCRNHDTWGDVKLTFWQQKKKVSVQQKKKVSVKEETESKAEATIKEEGYEEEIHVFKAWKEVRRMYSESISVGCVR